MDNLWPFRLAVLTVSATKRASTRPETGSTVNVKRDRVGLQQSGDALSAGRARAASGRRPIEPDPEQTLLAGDRMGRLSPGRSARWRPRRAGRRRRSCGSQWRILVLPSGRTPTPRGLHRPSTPLRAPAPELNRWRRANPSPALPEPPETATACRRAKADPGQARPRQPPTVFGLGRLEIAGGGKMTTLSVLATCRIVPVRKTIQGLQAGCIDLLLSGLRHPRKNPAGTGFNDKQTIRRVR